MTSIDWNGLSGALVAAGTFVTTLTGGWAALRAQRRPPGERARRRARRGLRVADRRLSEAEAQLASARIAREHAVRFVAAVEAEEAREEELRAGVRPTVRLEGPGGVWTDQVLSVPPSARRGPPPTQ